MKRRKDNQFKTLAFGAIAILVMLATAFLLADPMAGLGIFGAMALTIGGVELSDKEEALYNALKEAISTEVGKLEKGYISETKAKETITALMAKFVEEKGISQESLLAKVQGQLDEMGTKVTELLESSKGDGKEVSLKHMLGHS